MISLKHLLILMTLLSVLMMAAVVFVKLKSPDHVSFGEVRAIDRLCQRFAGDMLSEVSISEKRQASQDGSQDSSQDSSQESDDSGSNLKQLHQCLAECRGYLIQSRAKKVKRHQEARPEIPKCFGPKLTALVQDARSKAEANAPSKPDSTSE